MFPLPVDIRKGVCVFVGCVCMCVEQDGAEEGAVMDMGRLAGTRSHTQADQYQITVTWQFHVATTELGPVEHKWPN